MLYLYYELRLSFLFSFFSYFTHFCYIRDCIAWVLEKKNADKGLLKLIFIQRPFCASAILISLPLPFGLNKSPATFLNRIVVYNHNFLERLDKCLKIYVKSTATALPYYRKLTMYIDNAKIYVTQNYSEIFENNVRPTYFTRICCNTNFST